MTCGKKHCNNAPTEATKVDHAEVEGRPLCDHPGCNKRVVGTGERCADGHVQGQGQAAAKAREYEVAVVRLLVDQEDAEETAAEATDATATVSCVAHVGVYVRPAAAQDIALAEDMLDEDFSDRPNLQIVEIAVLTSRGQGAAISDTMVDLSAETYCLTHLGGISRAATAADVQAAEECLGEPLPDPAPIIAPAEALATLQALAAEWIAEGTLPADAGEGGTRYAAQYAARNAAALYDTLEAGALPLDNDPRWQAAQAFIRDQVLPPQLFTQVGDLAVHHLYREGEPLGWHYQVRDPAVAGDDPLEGWIDFDIRDLLRDRNDMPANEDVPNRERHRRVLEQAQADGTLPEWIATRGRRGRTLAENAPLRAELAAPPAVGSLTELKQWVQVHGAEVGDWPVEIEVATFALLEGPGQQLYVLHAYDDEEIPRPYHYTMLAADLSDRTFDIRELARAHGPPADWEADDVTGHVRLLEQITGLTSRY